MCVCESERERERERERKRESELERDQQNLSNCRNALVGPGGWGVQVLLRVTEEGIHF